MRFSLLLATLNRTVEMRPLLDSLAAQTWRDFELVVIDQNADSRLEEILLPYRHRFEIRHLRSARGHSRALNFGLIHAAGDLVAFPDDDCWYDPGTLARVAAYFHSHPESSGLTGREVVAPEFTTGSRWDWRTGPINRTNIWQRAITFTIFVRRRAAVEYAFDETLGIGAGTQWGAGEETDYLLQLLNGGHRIEYDPTLTVWHQGRTGRFTAEVYNKANHYARGIGRVLRINRFPLHLVAYHLIRPFGGTVLALARGRVRQSLYHWAILRGRAAGWAAAPPSERAESLRTPVPDRGANV